jgi:hypothetical protein
MVCWMGWWSGHALRACCTSRPVTQQVSGALGPPEPPPDPPLPIVPASVSLPHPMPHLPMPSPQARYPWRRISTTLRQYRRGAPMRLWPVISSTPAHQPAVLRGGTTRERTARHWEVRGDPPGRSAPISIGTEMTPPPPPPVNYAPPPPDAPDAAPWMMPCPAACVGALPGPPPPWWGARCGCAPLIVESARYYEGAPYFDLHSRHAALRPGGSQFPVMRMLVMAR